MPKRAVVIGAGIIGTATALELSRKGWDVTVIEPHKGPGLGSTSYSSSVVRCHYTRPEAIALAHEGACLWGKWSQHIASPRPKAQYHNTGVLFLVRRGSGGPPSESLGVKAEMDQHGLEQRVAMMRQAGVRAELMEQNELKNYLPNFHFAEEDVVGIWEPDSGYVFPPVGAVVDLYDAAQVTSANHRWEKDRRWLDSVVVAQGGETSTLNCDVAVNCAGPNSSEVNRRMNCPLSISTAPQRQFICEATWLNPAKGTPAMADLAEGFYIRPHPEVFKIGAALASDHVDFSVDAADPKTEQALQQFERRVLASLERRLPGVRLEHVETKVAFYDWSVSDSYPIIDGTDVGGYYVAIGSSGAWFKSGPVLGQLMAETVDRRAEGNWQTDFTLPLTGNRLNLDAFSIRSRLAKS